MHPWRLRLRSNNAKAAVFVVLSSFVSLVLQIVMGTWLPVILGLVIVGAVAVWQHWPYRHRVKANPVRWSMSTSQPTVRVERKKTKRRRWWPFR